jgi:TRAP-type mannitol/chloroaromatic compound transport system permease small subunit
MKEHPPLFIFVPLIIIACYLGWSLISGSLRIRGAAKPISREDSPREYWYYMRIILVVFALVVGIAAWVFL